MEYDIELSSPKVLDITAGMSAVPYSSGDPSDAATTIAGAGANACPVPEGQFWVGVTTGASSAAHLGPTDLATGYIFVTGANASELKLPQGYSLEGVWNSGYFMCADRTPGSSNFWTNAQYTYQFPHLSSTINGNVLYVVASSLVGLLRLIGKRTA